MGIPPTLVFDSIQSAGADEFSTSAVVSSEWGAKKRGDGTTANRIDDRRFDPFVEPEW
jgi:hypothetical protein